MNNEKKMTDEGAKDRDLFTIIIDLIKFTKKHFKTFLFATASACIIYLLLSLLPSKNNITAFTTATTSLQAEEISEILPSVSLSFTKDAIELNAGKLNLSPDIIQRIESVIFKQTFSANSNPEKYFKINLTLKSTPDNQTEIKKRVFDSIQNGISFYFNNIPYIRERYEFRKVSTEKLQHDIADQIGKLESLQAIQISTVLKSGPDKTGLVSYKSLSTEIIEMKRKQQQLDSIVKFDRPVTFIQDFTLSNETRPFFSGKIKILLSLLPFVLIFAIYSWKRI